MKYLGYIVLLAAFFIGVKAFHPGLLIICALLSTFIHMSARRHEVKHKNYTGDRNMVLDGMYLLAVQGLIMFTAYLLGWLIINQKETLLAFLHLG